MLENTKHQAKEVCQHAITNEYSWWKLANSLKNIGVPPHRAKRMATKALRHRLFMWEGRKAPLFGEG